MGDVKKSTTKKTTKKSSKTSSVKKNINKEVVLSNEELLEQILNKKKTKSTKKTTSKTNTSKVSETKKATSKKTKQFNQLENDFIYDQIKNGKTKKKKSTTTKKKTEVVKKLDTEEKVIQFKDLDKEKTIEELEKELGIEEEIVKEVEYDTYNSLEEKVKAKKENKQDEFEEFITEIENAQLLADIKKALEDDRVEYVKPEYEVSNKKAIEKIDLEINERLKTDIGNKAKRNINFKFIILIGIAILIVFLVVLGVNRSSEYINKVEEKKELLAAEKAKKELEKKQKKDYESCLVRPLDENDTSEEINNKMESLKTYLKDNYRLSVSYEDLTYGFSFNYNKDVDYYAASTIKSLAAMYIYEQAFKGEINLDDTITYSSKYRRGSSLEMKKHKYGDKISLRNLVKYSVTVSDNTAHNMLVQYVGVSKLKKYGNEMGANLTHLNGDLFGYIDLDDAIIYMKKLNDLIHNTGDFGIELESYFLSAEQNSLELSEFDIKAAHKYGEYEYVYHDIGIVYDKNPYVIAVLTHEGRKDYDAIIKDVNKRVYDLHNEYYKNRESYCRISIYGK